MAEPLSLRERIRRIIFEAETPAGRIFDIFLLWLIVLSVVAVMMESVADFQMKYGAQLRIAEWVFTILFTLEYVTRLWVVHHSWRYAKSFFGVVDLVSCLPTYLSLLLPGAQSLLVVRVLRLLRVFRIFKMVRHISGAEILLRALVASRAKITVFFFSLVTLVVIAGTVMYLVEDHENGFDSIPSSVYWAIVTITTVGFGDITPNTIPGKIIASICMLAGYAIIAVPTGIITGELSRLGQGDRSTDACPSCGVHGHLPDAKFCRRCGDRLDE